MGANKNKTDFTSSPQNSNDYSQEERTTDNDKSTDINDEMAPTLIINPAEHKDETYRVINVVDGDTIDIAINNKKQRVRLIGVNTPETVHPNKEVECFGKEASNYTKSQLLNQNVVIEVDDSQGMYDKYDRLLAYVYLRGENFNLNLIVNGYAYEYTYNTPYQYQAQFKKGQAFAEKHNTGLWAPGVCN